MLTTDPNGLITTNLTNLNQNDTTSYFDSGSNALYFEDSDIPNCTRAMLPDSFARPRREPCRRLSPAAINQAAMVNFPISRCRYTLFTANPSFSAFSNLGGSAGQLGSGSLAGDCRSTIGHSVYTAMESGCRRYHGLILRVLIDQRAVAGMRPGLQAPRRPVRRAVPAAGALKTVRGPATSPPTGDRRVHVGIGRGQGCRYPFDQEAERRKANE